jgi:hypothetical protein
MFLRFINLLVLFVGFTSARYLEDSDPNAIRREVIDPAQRFVTTQMEEFEEQTEPDSCDDYPPASCISHFHPLPRNLNRSPFNLRTEPEFTLICESYKLALQCVGEWVSNCKPGQPDARAFIDKMLALLGQCDNHQVREDSLKVLECGRRMGSVHERCIRETRFIPQLKNLSAEKLVLGEPNSIRDLCCGMRYHKSCYMDQVEERCGPEALQANQRLETIVMNGFNCDVYPDSECPSLTAP